ncbi:hypothetical protein [Burkholderia stabilis]|uniref:hypothetical protein n=1 Tax=Burkholderia stabilis TaxID=95485 RepID=UPI0009F36087|nr:hypothetical protein [Burkholderia stabilis]HDR9489373.1 hypothetical protein [Burkholderia stabilis]HDR9521997.1 hypothetical protein [Burkholderia stabilis]HDR9529056.1 hypothetical protein [Burkholderia stabilis]HDR9535531.1 hypothetical protein [Burkholderia stabilis]HDR9545075.1 hypothetical protein [Burkholderia stabilis]
MKIVKNCWDLLAAFDCQYGAHFFDGKDAYIYVNDWLGVFGVIEDDFCKKNQDGFVGHCVLVFRGVKRFDFVVTPYEVVDGAVSWKRSIPFNYAGDEGGGGRVYELAGSLHGFASSVSICVDSAEFELHILGVDEPSRRSQF